MLFARRQSGDPSPIRGGDLLQDPFCAPTLGDLSLSIVVRVVGQDQMAGACGTSALAFHRSYRSSDLLGDLVEVFYVAFESADLVHVVAELELVGFQRDIALHVKVLQTPVQVTKAYFYQQWFNIAQLEATSDLPQIFHNGQLVPEETFEVRESDYITVKVLDPEDIREMKRQRHCPASASSSDAPPPEAHPPDVQAAVGPSLMQQSRSLGPRRTFADILGGRERSRSPVAGFDILKVYGENLLVKECPCAQNTWIHSARTCILGPECLALPGFAMENAYVMEIFPHVKEASHVKNSYLFASSGTLRPGQVLIFVELIENVPDTIGRHSKARRVLKVHAEYTRATLLQDLGVAEKCEEVTCLVLQGNTMWPSTDKSPRFAAFGGSYTVIATHDEEERECPTSSSSVSLLQVQAIRRVHTFASVARTRLPPPGNGKRVRFDEFVETADEEGILEHYVDPLIQNHHFNGFLDKLELCLKENEFGHNFGQLLRSPTFHESHAWLDNHEWPTREHPGESLDKETHDDGVDFLPIMVEQEEEKKQPAQVISLAESVGSEFRPMLGRPKEDPHPQYGVDCQAVIQTMDWFNHHACMPLFPEDLLWKHCTVPWISLPHWDGSCPQECHFYLDGSAVEHHAGAAVVLWVFTTEWQWAGALMHKLEDGQTAYEAEVVAHLLMMKWVHDLWRTQGPAWTCKPKVVSHFDSTSAAGTVLGWHHARDLLTMKARGLCHLLKHGHHVDLEADHTYGHRGDPGNEAADSLAKYAALHSHTREPFWQGFCSEVTVPSLYVQWFWILARKDLRAYWHAGCLQPPQPVTEEDAQVLQELVSWQAARLPGSPHRLCMKAVTCNVMTLSKNYLSSYAATKGFLDLCHMKGIGMVAIQETRLKGLHFGHSEYVTIGHPSKKGQGGVLLALHRRFLRIEGDISTKETLAEKHVTVIASTHEILIVRVWYGPLDILVLVAHAPHTGRPFEETQTFWSSFATLIPPNLQDKDLVVFVDANARLGSRLSEVVGGCHAQKGEFEWRTTP